MILLLKPKFKKAIIISVVALVVLVAFIGGIFLYNYSRIANSTLEVQPLSNLTTQFWEDGANTSGYVSGDYIQELFPEPEKNISAVFVAEGDTVKKGDKLVEYDRSKLELAEQSASLELQKIDYKISTAQKELTVLNNTSAYVEPAPVEPIPLPESTATVYSYIDASSVPYKGTGTSEDPFVFLCTEDVVIDPAYLTALMGTDTTVTPDSTTDTNSDANSNTNTQANPAVDNGGEVVRSKPFAAIFAVHQNNNENDSLLYGFRYDGIAKDYSFVLPQIVEPVIPEQPPVPEGPLYSQEELDNLRKQKKQEIEDLELSKKNAQITYDSAKLELNNATIYSTIDGKVTSLIDVDDAKTQGKAFLTVAGNDGVYIKSAVNESMLSKVNVGAMVTINSWETGTVIEGEVVSISSYPVESNYYSSSQNPNNSNYEMIVYVEDTSQLKNNSYVDIQFPSSGASNSLFVLTAYVRSDNAGSYVLKADENNKIVKQYVKTGRNIYNNYAIEILSGLTGEEKIAFPYGKEAVEGATAKESDGGFAK